MRGYYLTALFVCCDLLQAQTTPQFIVADTGILAGFQASQGTAISNSGTVVGYSASPGFSFSPSGSVSGTAEAWSFTKGILTDLGSNNQSVTIPLGVNAAGQIVGLTGPPSGSMAINEFFYQNGKFQTPSGLPQGVVPTGINDAGLISGTVNAGQAGQVAGFWNGRSEVPLTLPPGATMAWGNAINATGEIAGAYASSATTIEPVVWLGGQPRSFTLPVGFSEGMAFAINNSGQAVGLIFAPSSANTHAALFSNGTTVDLGAVPGTQGSAALGINDSGWAVGFGTPSGIDTSGLGNALAAFSPPVETTHAFLWLNGTIYDLNTLLANGSGWVLSYAAGINNSGQIVGTGFHNGVQTAFVLTPVSAATGPAVTGISGGGTGIPPITSGGWFLITGRNLTNSIQPAFAGVTNTYSTNLAQSCVQVGNGLAQLNYVSATQINAIAPTLQAGAVVPVSVISNCGTPNASASLVFDASVAPPSPGFLYWTQNSNGQNPVVAVEVGNGALVGPSGGLSGVTLVPARPGDLITIYYNTGISGQTSPSAVTVGGQFASLIDLGVPPTASGLSPISFIVPQGLASGNQPIVVTLNGASSPSGAYLTIGQ